MGDVLLVRGHWIFDLDGTLTIEAHDFAAMKRELGLPPDKTLLEALREVEPGEDGPLSARVHAWEAEIAARTRAQPGVHALVDALVARGARLGVLTRNTAETAWITLDAIGLGDRFDPADVLGRDGAAAKPDPDGLHVLLDRWGAAPHDAVMVGNFLYDLLAGRAAGVATVLLDPDGKRQEWAEHADVVVRRLDELVAG